MDALLIDTRALAVFWYYLRIEYLRSRQGLFSAPVSNYDMYFYSST